MKCMNEILGRIGQYNVVDGKPCLAACEDQKNSVSITTSRYIFRIIYNEASFLGTLLSEWDEKDNIFVEKCTKLQKERRS